MRLTYSLNENICNLLVGIVVASSNGLSLFHYVLQEFAACVISTHLDQRKFRAFGSTPKNLKLSAQVEKTLLIVTREALEWFY